MQNSTYILWILTLHPLKNWKPWPNFWSKIQLLRRITIEVINRMFDQYGIILYLFMDLFMSLRNSQRSALLREKKNIRCSNRSSQTFAFQNCKCKIHEHTNNVVKYLPSSSSRLPHPVFFSLRVCFSFFFCLFTLNNNRGTRWHPTAMNYLRALHVWQTMLGQDTIPGIQKKKITQ